MTEKIPATIPPAPHRAEAAFKDFKPPYSEMQALAEANRCIYCHDAPCIEACPTSIDIPEFIRKITTGNLKGSARTIFASNILGMSCARVCPVEVLCVGACVYNEEGGAPVQIGRLQRYATDHAYAEGWRFAEAGAPTGKHIGLIRGGPASLAAAHELRRLGHACTIYEKRALLGGLNVSGVAPYKIRADRAAEEVEWVLGIGGIELKTGVEVGEDLSLEALEAQHDALFFGFGLGPDSRLEVQGEDIKGVRGAVGFIEEMKLGPVDLSGVEHALVIGGGNTAVDAVRELVTLGVPKVTLVYRGVEAGMKGYAHEWKQAKIEGVEALWQALPMYFKAKDGALIGVTCARVDEDKQLIPGSEFKVEAQLALMAIGQSKLGALLGDLEGIEVLRGRIIADEAGRTGRAGYFAGGDCVNGGKEVVNAAAEGKAAAVAIDAYLKTSSLKGAHHA
ncbi:FAD-dependent oxidoreductase [Myxococcota bacterium]|nr:FAD-dependent oxidoreductase [Myxococcota bacterium]